MWLQCPHCHARHIDKGEFATKPHHTHACQECGLAWRPAIGPTVGVEFLPGFKDKPDEPAATCAPAPGASPDGGFCTHCGHAFPSFEGLTGCPACGTKASPCANSEQVSISINWHELRILVMWAENWQRRVSGTSVIYSIAKRIAAQHPGKTPLTLAGELGEVAEKFPGMQVSDPKLRQDIAEQTGQEPGIIPPNPEEP